MISDVMDDYPPYRLKVCDIDEARDRCNALRTHHKTLVFTNGCFDILHVGHVHYLHSARSLGDFLIIGLNTDASVRGLKGDKRPITPLKERAAILASLSMVDLVVPFDDATPIPLLETLQPAIHVKGGDYTATALPEYPTVQSYGGHVKILPFVAGKSTSSTIDRLLKAYGPT